MKFDNEIWTISKLSELYGQSKIKLDPPYQRNPIWTLKSQQKLIETITQGMPIPNFFVRALSDGAFEMVDGQQRARTILGYERNQIPDENNLLFSRKLDISRNRKALSDEQMPWMVFLEFLNVFHHESEKNRAFAEPNGLNTLKYKAAHRLYLRNILFNNPHLAEIRLNYPSDASQWNEWFKRMKNLPGLNLPRFDYLKEHFHSFDNFCEVVSLVRTTSLEVDSNKRWTSKFVFPYGKDCLYEDLDNTATTNDRRFFGRTGEVLYLMLCRAQCKTELLAALKERLATTDTTWNSIIKCLQSAEDEQVSVDRANAFLPYAQHPCFDELAEDWLAVLRLNVPGFDVFPHLVNLVGLHLVKYQLSVSRQVLGLSKPLSLVCEVVAPKKTLVREISCGRAPRRVQQFDDAGNHAFIVGGLGLNRFAGLWFVARFAHKTFLRPLIFNGLPSAWRAIRLVAGTAMKTFGNDRAAAESSRILRVVASVPP